MKIEHAGAFNRGYWDSVQFAYIPDYSPEEIQAWYAGFQWGKAGKGEPSTEDFEELLKSQTNPKP